MERSFFRTESSEKPLLRLGYDERVELRHLQYFVAVATTGGFGRAARSLHVSQSAISEQVHDLEEEIGSQLFDRSQRQIRLTAEGEIFLEGAQATLAAAEKAVQSVQRSRSGEEGKLAIGFFVGGAGRFFPKLIREFRTQYPRVKLSIVEMIPSQQWSALQNGTLDIGFTRPIPSQLQGTLRSERFRTERMYVVLPKDHRLAGRKEIAIAELQDERFIMSERVTSPTLFDKVITLCADAHFSPLISMTATVSSAVVALVEAGEGIAILPDGSRFLGGEVLFLPLKGASAVVDMVIAWSPDRAEAVHRSFLQLARKFRTET